MDIEIESEPAPRARKGRPETVTATEAKNAFGKVLERALRDGMVVITRHDTPRALVVSIEEWNAATGRSEKELDLDALTRRFDGMIARMQTLKGRRSMEEAFAGSPTELSRAARAADRKRGKK